MQSGGLVHRTGCWYTKRWCTEDPQPELDTKLPLWTADWDDEDAAEDFAIKLKAELQKSQQQGSKSMDTSS